MRHVWIIVGCCLTVVGAALPLRIAHAANVCFDDFTAHGKFTLQECLDGVNDLALCKAAGTALASCAGPAGAAAALVAGNGTALLANLTQPLSDLLGSASGAGTPGCDTLIPYYKYISGQCQLAHPNELCSDLGQGPGGCCITHREKTNTPGGECTSETEQCIDKSPIYYSCCYCQARGESDTISHMAANSGQTYESCEEICKTPPLSGSISHALGAGTLQRQTAAPPPEQIQTQAMYCFTQAECTGEPYKGTFQAGGAGCHPGEGKCIAPEPEVKLSGPIGGVTTVKGFRGFVSTIFSYLIGIVATVAAVMFVYAGFRYIFGSAFEDIKRAKEIMVDAVIGLILVLSAIAILRTVNPMTLNLNVLEVFMINQSKILNERFCTDIKSTKPLLFAKAGASPAFIPFGKISDADYSLHKEQTACGEDYYAQGFGEFRCSGRQCPNGKGVCRVCEREKDCPEGTKKGAHICEDVQFAGNVNYADCRFIENIYLVGICWSMITKVDPNTPKNIDANYFTLAVSSSLGKGIQGSNSGSGINYYKFSFTKEDLDDIDEKCKALDPGGVMGFAISMEYNDEGITSAVTCESLLASDEIAIVTKNNCSNKTGFSAYQDGESYQSNRTVHTPRALFCGITAQSAAGTPTLQQSGRLWSLEELRKTVTDGKGIQCDFNIDDQNAPTNPVQRNPHKQYIGDLTCIAGLP